MNEFIKKKEVMEMLGISAAQLNRMIAGRNMPYYKLGPNKKGVPVRFKRVEVLKWLEARRIK